MLARANCPRWPLESFAPRQQPELARKRQARLPHERFHGVVGPLIRSSMATEKITRFVKVGFTETEAAAISFLAKRDSRDPSSYIRIHMRAHLFGIAERAGIVEQENDPGEWSNSAPAAL